MAQVGKCQAPFIVSPHSVTMEPPHKRPKRWARDALHPNDAAVGWSRDGKICHYSHESCKIQQQQTPGVHIQNERFISYGELFVNQCSSIADLKEILRAYLGLDEQENVRIEDISSGYPLALEKFIWQVAPRGCRAVAHHEPEMWVRSTSWLTTINIEEFNASGVHLMSGRFLSFKQLAVHPCSSGRTLAKALRILLGCGPKTGIKFLPLTEGRELLPSKAIWHRAWHGCRAVLY